MRDDGTRYSFDLAELKPLIDKNTRIFTLCNPQNPTGRVFSRAELTAIAEFVLEHDLIVISDEIHSDLIYPGHRHIPFASLGPEIAARTVTLNSATKSFNIPGLRCALIAFGSEQLLARFHRRIPPRLTGQGSIIGIDATIAAWSESQDWLDAVMRHLLKARNHVADVLATEAPEVQFHAPEATYLAWLDCSKVGLPASAFQFFLDNARIGFSAGETFDPDCAQFVRFNFATSMPILDQILGRFVDAVNRRNDRSGNGLRGMRRFSDPNGLSKPNWRCRQTAIRLLSLCGRVYFAIQSKAADARPRQSPGRYSRHTHADCRRNSLSRLRSHGDGRHRRPGLSSPCSRKSSGSKIRPRSRSPFSRPGSLPH